MDHLFSYDISHQLRDARVVSAEESLHTLAVNLEDTLSRWIIAAVRQNGRPALSNIEKQLEKTARRAAEEKQDGLGVDKARYKIHITVKIKPVGEPTLKAKDVERFLDKSGRNLTFDSKAQWDSIAGANLAQSFKAAAYRLNDEDWELFDFVKKLRNYIAHRSDRARRELNACLAAIRRSKHDFDAIKWPGNRTIKDQSGSRPGDLLLTVPPGEKETILVMLYVRVTAALLELRTHQAL